jgi:hypothetical protein
MSGTVSSHSPRSRRRPTGYWLILAGLLLLLVAGQSFAIYSVFTSKFPGGNDFFVYWLGGREYMLHGTNPFDPAVAEKIQLAVFGRPIQPGDKDQAYFAYPFYSLYFSWPLSLLPYPWARAIWMTLLQFMLLAITGLSIHLARWRPPAWLLGLTLLWGILLYNGARAIILGQFSILVALALLLALWAIEQRRDGWAGFLLAVTTIKPQMVILLLIFLFVWALFRRRWRLIGAFFITMLVLLTSSILLVPTWPLDFLLNAIAYARFIRFGTPLENLLHYLLPANLATPLTIILSVIFFGALLPGWWLAWRRPPGQRAAGAYLWAILTTLIVGNLITFRSATTNQMTLYLPLFFYFHRLSQRWSRIGPLLIEVGLAVLMWTVFISTLEGNWEHTMMHGLLPALMLLLYALDWRALFRTTQEQPYG